MENNFILSPSAFPLFVDLGAGTPFYPSITSDRYAEPDGII